MGLIDLPELFDEERRKFIPDQDIDVINTAFAKAVHIDFNYSVHIRIEINDQLIIYISPQEEGVIPNIKSYRSSNGEIIIYLSNKIMNRIKQLNCLVKIPYQLFVYQNFDEVIWFDKFIERLKEVIMWN